MSVLLLVRHGQASWGAEDYDVLSERGERQSRILGEALAARGFRPDLVVQGSMRRHRQTAEAVSAGAGWDVPPVVDEGWDEFDHQQMLALHPTGVGEDEELTAARFQEWFEQATARWTEGRHAEEYDESFAAFGRRVEAALARTVERLGPRESGVVFTSGGPVSWVAAHLLTRAPSSARPSGDAGAEVWQRLNPVVVNASVTKLVVGRRGTTLVSFNDHAHLEAAGLVTYR